MPGTGSGGSMLRGTPEAGADQAGVAAQSAAPGLAAKTTSLLQAFSVSYAFPVVFTAGLFEPENHALVDVLSRLEPDRRHRCLFFVDDGLLAARPGLSDEIRAYAERH